MFSVCFYWCISCSVIISYLLTAVFDARLMRLIKPVIHSFIFVRVITVAYCSFGDKGIRCVKMNRLALLALMLLSSSHFCNCLPTRYNKFSCSSVIFICNSSCRTGINQLDVISILIVAYFS